MLFLTSSLRKHALGRGQRWRAEAVLTSLAESFARAKTAQGLSNTIMIYDSITKRRVRHTLTRLTSLFGCAHHPLCAPVCSAE
jgi:hypothetical protein